MGKFPHFWAKFRKKLCKGLHLLRVDFSTEGVDKWAMFLENPLDWLRAGIHPPAILWPVNFELHHFYADHYLLLIEAREHSPGINRYRGKNSLSFIPLPCLWTKKKFTCLHYSAEAVSVSADVMYLTLFNGSGLGRSMCWICQRFTSWPRAYHSICNSFNICTKQLRIPS